MNSSLRATVAAALLVLWVGNAAGASLPGIHGTDDRELVDSVGTPWNAIGRLNREGGGFCTGVAIDRRTVLTAAHCLWNRRTRRWGQASTIHFLAGYRRGEYLQHARVASYHVGGEGLDRAGKGPGDDWAILTLVRPLDGSVLPLPVAPLASTATHLQAGYSQDTPHMLTVDRSCTISRYPQDGRLLVHDCDATHGSSGAPLLGRDDVGRYRVIGLHVGHTQGGGAGIGVSVPEILMRQQQKEKR